MNAPPAIDPALLAVQSFDDPALATEILGMFAAQAPELLRGLLATSGPARSDVAHRFAGSALAIGAPALAAAAARLESAPGDPAALQAVEMAVAAVLADIAARSAP